MLQIVEITQETYKRLKVKNSELTTENKKLEKSRKSFENKLDNICHSKQ